MSSLSLLFPVKTEDIGSELVQHECGGLKAALQNQIDLANKQIENAWAAAENALQLAQDLGISLDAELYELRKLPGGADKHESRREERVLLVAETIYRSRRERAKYFASKFFGEPAWDMLIDLFIAQVRGKKITTTSLCVAADVPQTTALRYINALESKGLIERFNEPGDRRLNYTRLSSRTFDLVWKFIEKQSGILFSPHKTYRKERS